MTNDFDLKKQKKQSRASQARALSVQIHKYQNNFAKQNVNYISYGLNSCVTKS